MPPKGNAPTDTLTAAQSIARYPWYQPERLFRLLGEFCPVLAGKTMRPVPFMPYLNFPPSAWVLPLKFVSANRAGQATLVRPSISWFAGAWQPANIRVQLSAIAEIKK